MIRKKNLSRILAGIMAAALALPVTGCAKKDDSGKFTPRLDTNAKVTLDVMGFFNNFEAFDQVTNDFNEYYPGVSFGYEQVGGENLEEYLDANPGVDIFMTSDQILTGEGNKLAGRCVDLSKEDINLDAIDDKMLVSEYYDGKLLSIPMSQNLYGLVVNVTLLENAGLSVPQNYSEFLNALKVLKDKGYVPIQGPSSKVYAELTLNMFFSIVGNDEELYNALLSGDKEAGEKLKPIFDILETIRDNGYTDAELNDTYPYDNYDGAIMKFFDGDVPFWVCNTEKVSGMKKRESKSEAYKAEPFEYTYIFAPLGDEGAYVYREPWVGFAVSKDSDAYDYAVEFIRFLAQKDEINKIAEVKGVPSAAVEINDNEIYKNVVSPKNVQESFIKDKKEIAALTTIWYSVSTKYMTGGYADADEAIDDFISMSAQ